jgi:hypothetical protein
LEEAQWAIETSRRREEQMVERADDACRASYALAMGWIDPPVGMTRQRAEGAFWDEVLDANAAAAGAANARSAVYAYLFPDPEAP